LASVRRERSAPTPAAQLTLMAKPNLRLVPPTFAKWQSATHSDVHRTTSPAVARYRKPPHRRLGKCSHWHNRPTSVEPKTSSLGEPDALFNLQLLAAFAASSFASAVRAAGGRYGPGAGAARREALRPTGNWWPTWQMGRIGLHVGIDRIARQMAAGAFFTQDANLAAARGQVAIFGFASGPRSPSGRWHPNTKISRVNGVAS
jgi:hypothetical protein